MKRTFLVAAVCGFGVFAQAQTTSVDTTGLRLRLGGIYPTEKATRKVTGNMLAIGLDYTVHTGKDGETYLSIDWYGKSSGGAKGNIFPLLINKRFYTNKNEDDGNRSYLTVGAGPVSIDVNKAKIAWGGRIGIGKEFGKNLFGEGAFLATTDAAGARATSFGLFVGYRF